MMDIAEKTDDELKYFDYVREQLRYWPYTLHQIEDTLDISLIEGRAKQTLFKAINSHNLVAFAGSGLSMSYGRLGWREWATEQQRVVGRNATAFCDLAKRGIDLISLLILCTYGGEGDQSDFVQSMEQLDENTREAVRTIRRKIQDDKRGNHFVQMHRHNAWQWLRNRLRAIENAKRQIERLADTFKLAKDGDGAFPGGEELPVKFEIAQQLHRQLRQHYELFVDAATLDKVAEKFDDRALSGTVEQTKNSAPTDAEAKEFHERAWSGALQRAENSAPTEAIDWLRSIVGLQRLEQADGSPVRVRPQGSGLEDAPVRFRAKPALLDRQIADFRKRWEDFLDLMARPEAKLSFERLAKTLLVDECPHALLLLRRGLLKNNDIDPEPDRSRSTPELQSAQDAMVRLEQQLDLFNDCNLKRGIDGIREVPSRYRVLTPFKFENFDKIRASAKTSKGFKKRLWNGFTGRLEKRLETYREKWELAGDKRVYLTPMSRFLVPVYLAMCDKPFEALGVPEGNIPNGETEVPADPNVLERPNLLAEPKKGDFSSRRSIIADRFDPLAKAVRKLGINRYITTNYDFEIERFFQDRGYRTFPLLETDHDQAEDPAKGPSPDEFRTDGVGGMLRDYTFERETAADLTAFVIDASTQDAAVFHLHGRATETDPLVITERDYLKLYLTQDEFRDTVDEGISIAFSGAPVLFLGLGMGETDLLRPLRQFISNRDRTIGYASMALLPADGPLEARTKFSSALYLRYGVYTIFYGSGYIEIEDQERGIDWLHRILSLVRSLSKELDEWGKKERPEDRDAKAIAKDLYKALGEIGGDLADVERDYPANTSALAVLYGGTERFEKDKDAPESLLERMQQDECELRCCTFSPTRPRRGLWRTHHYDEDTFIKGDTYLGFFTDLLDQIVKAVLKFPGEMKGSRATRKKSLAPFHIALDGLQGAFVTGALNAALDGIAEEKNSWWKKWQESPPHRKAAFQRLEPRQDEKPRKCLWDQTAHKRAHINGAVFVRHQVDNVITPKLKADFDAPNYGDPVCKADSEGNWRVKPKYATRIRAFDTFVTAAEATFGDYPTEQDTGRRRVITVAAHRGLGKGTFMSAFSTERGRALYRSAVWPKKPKGEVEFVAQVFVNLGFSPEIASVYDMLSNALADSIGYLRQKWLFARAKDVWLDLDQRPADADPEEVRHELEARGLSLDPDLIIRALDREKPFGRSPFETILTDPRTYPGRAGLTRETFELSCAVAMTRLLEAPPQAHAENEPGEFLKRLFVDTHLVRLGEIERKEGEKQLHDMKDSQVCDLYRDQLQVAHREVLKDQCQGLSRLNQLELLFHAFRNASRAIAPRDANENTATEPTPRFLFNVYAIELLFDSSRRAKNGEIYRLLELFFGSQTEDCPIDFVYVGDEKGLGAPWDNPPNDNPKDKESDKSHIKQCRLRMDRKNLPPGGEEQIRHRLSVGHIRLDQRDQDPPNAPAFLHFVHFARPVNPVSLLVDNFRTLAMAFYLVNPPPPQMQNATEELEKSRKSFARAARSAREASDEVMTYLWTRKELPTKEELRKARDLGRSLEHDEFKPEPKGAKGPGPEVRKKLRTAQRRFAIVKERIKRHAEASAIGVTDGDLDVILLERLRRTNPQDGSEWHRIRHKMGASRIALTLLLAACEHIVIHAPDAYEGGIQAQIFIRNTVEAVRNVGNERRDQMALEAVLNRYQRYHKIADPDLDYDLHAMILRHLGVISTPISSAVLVRLPEFRNYFQRIGIELEMSRRRFLVRALTVLAYRGLVFRLDPHPRVIVLGQDHDDWDDDKEYRYALHRIIQSFALSKLDPNAMDPLKRNSFAPTLYSSQASSGTQLTRDSYRFLRSLMIGLSQYPDVPQNELGIEPWLFTTRSNAVRAQAVRAALTLARSTYSVAVISRLSDQRPIGEGVEKRGHLETYRVRLRWIVRMAWELFKKPKPEPGRPDWYREDGDFDQVCALYRDEIVWLYNELGVISLVQGSLSDALGFLRQAYEFNERIEGRSDVGAIAHHINLNHAIVQMERGRLPSARNRLQLVREATKERAWTLHHNAKGYLCVLDHITGRRDGLTERFREVTDFFQKHNDSRAAAVFLNHRGRYLISVDREQANRCIMDARDMADTGGHEDLRHHIELSIIKLRLWKHQYLTNDAPRLAHSENLRELSAIEAYARRMGIWSLQCDVLRIRAEFLLLQGETTTAGRLLIRSMAICRRHAMRLRLNNALTIYAKVLHLRGDLNSARRMALLSLNLARGMNYNLETPRAQELLRSLDSEA